jgi:hypothetical protein
MLQMGLCGSPHVRSCTRPGRDGRVESEHIYWDQASVLAQIGLLPTSGLPVLAAGQAKALRDPAAPLNTLLISTN